LAMCKLCKEWEELWSRTL